MKLTGLTFDEARESVEYWLTYTRSTERREFDTGGISGDYMVDSDPNGKPGYSIPGDWSAEVTPYEYDLTDRRVDWFRGMFAAALSEGVHEVLEWFQVNEHPLIDPHNRNIEFEIFEICGEFADRLYRLKDKQ